MKMWYLYFTLHVSGEMTAYKSFAYIISVVILVKLIRKCLKSLPFACWKGDVTAQVSCEFISSRIF